MKTISITVNNSKSMEDVGLSVCDVNISTGQTRVN